MSDSRTGLLLHLDDDALRPLISAVVKETLDQSRDAQANVDAGRLAFSESEAAGMLGLESHVLRDERRRGRITASKIVGGRIRYAREDLIQYLASRKIN